MTVGTPTVETSTGNLWWDIPVTLVPDTYSGEVKAHLDAGVIIASNADTNSAQADNPTHMLVDNVDPDLTDVHCQMARTKDTTVSPVKFDVSFSEAVTRISTAPRPQRA